MGIFTDGRQMSSLGSTRRDSPIHCCYFSWLQVRELHAHAPRPSSNPPNQHSPLGHTGVSKAESSVYLIPRMT